MKSTFLDIFQNNQKLTNGAVKILIGLMFGVAAVSIVQLGQRLTSSSGSWNGWYLPFLVFLISQDAFWTKPKLDSFDFTQKSIYHITEWIIFAVLLKIIIYLVHSPDQFWVDLPLWQQNLAYFFSGEYLPVLLILFLTWLFSYSAAGDMYELQIELTDYKWELGKLDNNRQAARHRLAQKILVVGGVMVIIAIASRLEFKQLFGETPASQASLAYVLIFFMLALVFLSLTQFAVLRGRWFWNQTPIALDIGRNWVKYSILFFALIALIAFLLPTRYSYGLLETIQAVVAFLFQLSITLVGLLALPCGWLFSLMRTGDTTSSATPTPVPQFIPPVQTVGGANPWWDLVKSILFWSVFLGVIGYSFFYFIKHNSIIFSGIKKITFLGSIFKTAKSFWFWLVGINRQLASVIARSIARVLQSLPGSISREFPHFINFKNLTPRQQVVFFYLRMLDRSKKSGIDRKPNQTPQQFSSEVEKVIPEVERDLDTFTDQFIEARYTRHPIETEQTSTVQRLWRKIAKSLNQAKVGK